MRSAAKLAEPLGLEGWEMVTCTLQPLDREAVGPGPGGGGGANIYNLNLRGQKWFATALLKRPIAQ